MGVFTLRRLVWGQLILLTLALNKIMDAQQTDESRKSATTAPPLNTTGNQTANNASISSSNSTYSDNTTTQNSSTTQMTPSVSMNSTSGATLSKLTVTASTEHPPTTENDNTTQLVTSSTTTTNSAAVTSTNSTEKTTASSTKPVTITTAITYTVQNSTHSVIDSQGLNRSEQSLTIFFSVLLGLIVLVTLVHFVYKFSRSKERSIQYTHRRLQNEDTGEPFAVADDTMVISGGLYDGPQIYNPTMTVQNEEEFQTDAYGFGSIPTQFRLEFLREDQDRALDHETSTFQTFQAQDQEP
ncbi:sialomucin core protein 24-like isoform X2 [Danio aesculapii]|uniref:sialomucin core protein 24-like isoform X2 n=1 Tax=Danio aesculapii TaxID=1142201 RepID=UPI0024BF5279|nr:sialomucin core protein 24-like isoform X2 [Danio aesculapii]